jgi:DNA-binding NarL/FixJ family response regulator
LGADGYIPKRARREVLLAAIRRVAAGKSAWTRAQLRRICHADGNRQWSAGDPPLTPRETDVLRKVAEGHVNEEIGGELGIHLETVKQHVKSILRKLGVKDRTEAALWAVRKGIL